MHRTAPGRRRIPTISERLPAAAPTRLLLRASSLTDSAPVADPGKHQRTVDHCAHPGQADDHAGPEQPIGEDQSTHDSDHAEGEDHSRDDRAMPTELIDGDGGG